MVFSPVGFRVSTTILGAGVYLHSKKTHYVSNGGIRYFLHEFTHPDNWILATASCKFFKQRASHKINSCCNGNILWAYFFFGNYMELPWELSPANTKNILICG